MTNISRQITAQLHQELLNLLRDIGEIAVARGESAYLVGGVVRDVILKRPNYDLDVVIEGKAISLAQQLAKNNDWEIKKHPRFGTAKISWADFSLDLVTARSETYLRPGALPTIAKGTIQNDLARRDFTINAMAINLNPDSFGELLDPHNGQDDLQNKLIRILHSNSFNDDPTRIFRAVRYEQRLGFRLDLDTEERIRSNVDSIKTVTAERVWHEIEMILREEYPENHFHRADELGVLQQLHPALNGDKWLVQKYVKARKIEDKSLSLPSIYLSLLCYRLSNEEIGSFITRLKMTGWAVRVLMDTIRIKQIIPQLDKVGILPSDIYLKLQPHSPEVIVSTSIASDSPTTQERIHLYLNELRYVKPSLTGKDLQNLGFSKGKRVGQILWVLHAAKLDREIADLEEEKNLAQELLHTST